MVLEDAVEELDRPGLVAQPAVGPGVDQGEAVEGVGLARAAGAALEDLAVGGGGLLEVAGVVGPVGPGVEGDGDAAGESEDRDQRCERPAVHGSYSTGFGLPAGWASSRLSPSRSSE